MNTKKNIEEISTDIIDDILDKIRYVPTGDNSQHWNFKWQKNQILIYHNKERAKHILNDHFHASLLSLGCIIENIDISAKFHGLDFHVDYFLEDLTQDLLATVTLFTMPTDPDMLYPFIEKRETNRNPFSRQPLKEEWLKPVMQKFTKMGVNIHSLERPDKRFFKFLLKCEQYIWFNREVLLDTVKWIRFNEGETIASRDGMNLENVKLKKIDAYFLKLFRQSAFLQKLVWYFGARWKVNFDAKSVLKNTSNFVCVTINDTRALSLVNAGRAMYRTWLVLTKNNYAVQPMTIASLLPYVMHNKSYLRGCNMSFTKSFADAPKILKKSFNLNAENPVWMIRTGGANPLDPGSRTTRRNIKDFML